MEAPGQESLFTKDVSVKVERIRCRICGKALSSKKSIIIGIGPECRKKIDTTESTEKRDNPICIDNHLIEMVRLWTIALSEYVSEDERNILSDLCESVEQNRFMSPITIANEIDKVIDLYHKRERDINRDDIKFGLYEIAKITGKKIGGYNEFNSA